MNLRRLLVTALVVLGLVQPASAQLRTKLLVPTRTITTALTGVTSEVVTVPYDTRTVTVQAVFTYGSAGTNAKAWVQTSLDGGTTWVDIMNFAYLITTATTVNSIRVGTAVAANYAPTDGTLADNTIKDGILGDRLRVKITTTGTYAGGTTLKLTAIFSQ